MNIRTLKRIKFVLVKFYRDKICFLSCIILKYFKQNIFLLFLIHTHTQCIMIISTPIHFSYFPETLAKTSPCPHIFSYYFHNHWVQAQSHACNMTSGNSQCSGLSCPDRSISLVTFFEGPPSEMFSESWLSPQQSLNLSTLVLSLYINCCPHQKKLL